MYLQDYARAKECHQAALREDPQYAQACYGLAVACGRLGETDQSRQHREKYAEMIAESRVGEQRRVRQNRDEAERQEALAQGLCNRWPDLPGPRQDPRGPRAVQQGVGHQPPARVPERFGSGRGTRRPRARPGGPLTRFGRGIEMGPLSNSWKICGTLAGIFAAAAWLAAWRACASRRAPRMCFPFSFGMSRPTAESLFSTPTVPAAGGTLWNPCQPASPRSTTTATA